MSFTTLDLDEAERIFVALAESDDLEMTIEEVFWAPRFGVCTDRFGTPWIVSADHPAEG